MSNYIGDVITVVVDQSCHFMLIFDFKFMFLIMYWESQLQILEI